MTAEQRKDRYKKLLAAGKCPGHPQSAVAPGLTTCRACADYRAKYGAKRRQKNAATGTCAGHPHNKVVEGTTMCQECFDTRTKRSARLKRAGKCLNHPDRDAVSSTSCQECLDKGRLEGGRRRAKNKAAGMCVYHRDRRAVRGTTQCQPCLEYLAKHGPVHAGIRRARKLLTPYEEVNPATVIERDGNECQHCHKVCDGDAEADHVVPISVGGPHTYWNHQCLCRSCNSRKKHHVRKEPRLAHLVHLPIRDLIEAFAKEHGATLPRGWWKARQKAA